MFSLCKRRIVPLLSSCRRSELAPPPPAYHLVRSKERTIERCFYEELSLTDYEYQIFGRTDLVGGRRYYSRPSPFPALKPIFQKIEPMTMFERVKSAGGCFMALDIDNHSVGVAVSDGDYQTAIPLDNLKLLPKISVSDIWDLHCLVIEYKVKGLVIGETLTPLGESQEDNTKKDIERYVKKLVEFGRFGGLQYCYMKENFTSQIAEYLVNSCSELTNEEKKKMGDNVAAALILQAFLNNCNGHVI